LEVTRDGRQIKVDVVPDGEGLVSHAGSVLLARVADKTGLTRALSRELASLKQRQSGHDQGRVTCDLAVMLGDGGDCLADLGALGDQRSLFGDVASASTAFRLIDRIASDPAGLERLRAAHAQARACVWKLTGAPERLTIDLDATLIGSHSEKEGAAGNFKGGYGFHPMLAYADETDQPGEIAHVEREHRGRARVEDHIRNDKDTGMRNLPFRDFEHNRVWLEIVRIAHHLISWTQRLLLTGELARCEPKRLRYRLLHIAARLAFHARTATLHIQASWPWASELTIAFQRLRALPVPAA
jgi:hypothetical protein